MKKKITLTKYTRSSFLTYGLVIAAYVILQSMVLTGSITSSLKGMLVPICAYAVMAVSLNLTVGVLGELSLGHAGFMSVGAFTGVIAAIALEGIVPMGWLRLVIAMAVGAVFAAVAGFLIGIPVLRLKGDYLAIVTLAFGEIIKSVLNNLYVGVDGDGLHFSLLSDRTGLAAGGRMIVNGPMGITGITKLSTFTAGFVLLMLTLFIVFNLVNSRTGRAIKSIRDNRIAAESVGINVTKYGLRHLRRHGRRRGASVRHELLQHHRQQVRLQHLHPGAGVRGAGRPGQHAWLHHRRHGADHPAGGPAPVRRLPDADLRHRADPGDAHHQQPHTGRLDPVGQG